MSKQSEALRLAEVFDGFDIPLDRDAAKELRRLHKVNKKLLKALELALKQNEHDMIMTGEECRKAQAAITEAKEDEK